MNLARILAQGPVGKTDSAKRRSVRSEDRAARLFKGRRQPASGALPVASLKGDVVAKDWLIEDKITTKESFSVSMKIWRKIREQAFKCGQRKPLLRVSLDNGKTTLIVTTEYDFLDLCQSKANC